MQRPANKGDSGETEASLRSSIPLPLLMPQIFSLVRVRDVPEVTDLMPGNHAIPTYLCPCADPVV
jgi:hypothetical protein